MMRRIFRGMSISSLTITLGIILTSGLIIALPQYPKRLVEEGITQTQSHLSQKISDILRERINGLQLIADLYADGVIKNKVTHAHYAGLLMEKSQGLRQIYYIDNQYRRVHRHPNLPVLPLGPRDSPEIMALAERAVGTRSLVISDPVTTAGEPESHLIVLVPVKTKEGVDGLIEGVFSTSTIARDLVNPLIESNVPYQLVSSEGVLIGGNAFQELESTQSLTLPIHIGEHRWVLKFPVHAIFQHTGVRILDLLIIPYDWLSLLFGLGIIMVFTFGTLGLTRQNRKLEEKNQEIAKLYDRLQSSLRQTEHEYRRIEMILENVPAGVCVIDADSGKVVIANRDASALFGQPLVPGSIVPILSESYALCQPSGEPYPLAELPIGKAVLGGISSVADDVTLVRPDGQRINLLMAGAPISTTDGEPTQIVLVFQDITEKVKMENQLQLYTEGLEKEVRRRTSELEQAERELRRSYEQLKKTQERLIEHERLSTIGKMSAIIAHEIRNPLSALHAAAQELSEGLTLPEEYQELLDIILSQSTRLSKVIQNTLTFTRPITLERRQVDMHQLINQLLVSLRGDSRFQNGIELTKRFADELPALQVDPDAIEQVLWNILLNAVQAIRHDHGRVQIATRWFPHGFNGMSDPCVEISVTDNGTGIPASQLSKIFEPFHTTKTQGTGLGLAVARRIIEAHGGVIKADSQVNRGTKMRILLPASAADEPSATLEERQ